MGFIMDILAFAVMGFIAMLCALLAVIGFICIVGLFFGWMMLCVYWAINLNPLFFIAIIPLAVYLGYAINHNI
jgi:hypothetical protein